MPHSVNKQQPFIAIDTLSVTSDERIDTPSILTMPQVPVLCYHRIENGTKANYKVSQATFEAHIKMLYDSGYYAITPIELYDYRVNREPLPSKPVMLTFDDSRVAHYTIAAPILEQYGFRGVFFIMTITCDKPNYLSKSQITQLAQRGHIIGLHSWDHTMATQYLTANDWLKQVVEPQKMLQELTGQPIDRLLGLSQWSFQSFHRSADELLL
ncbi:polysaccharide deacetylase family protein [Breznakibacter xylanolyticus]|uniref:polysaccharide deacetylase family protein n=1 Tax=Breznakibacter xylanolyticus TaxID=990 RepID=UPI00147323AE|nr:polysaccharide deacetylase family protein [Breznakibacter xylanolyticus]